MRKKLSINEENLLKELVSSDDAIAQYLQRLKALNERDKNIQYALLGILEEQGYINVLWADDEPAEIMPYPKSELYFFEKRQEQEKREEKQAIEQNNLDAPIINHASDIFGDTTNGMKGPEIVQRFNSYSMRYNTAIPYSAWPFRKKASKRAVLRANIKAFSAEQQYYIVLDLCEHPSFSTNEQVHALRETMVSRYGQLYGGRATEKELQKAGFWLEKYPRSYVQYKNAMAKYEAHISQRNMLDDLRLSLELLLKEMFNNDKSLENQITNICGMMKDAGIAAELRNMMRTTLDYYSKYQNNYIKHDSNVNENEISFVFELTSDLMKFIAKIKDLR